MLLKGAKGANGAKVGRCTPRAPGYARKTKPLEMPGRPAARTESRALPEMWFGLHALMSCPNAKQKQDHERAALTLKADAGNFLHIE